VTAVTLASVMRSVELWAFLAFLVALASAGFFGMMAWMAGAPLHAARRWLRRALYPGAIWLVAIAIHWLAVSRLA
jgi:hypothetical protein